MMHRIGITDRASLAEFRDAARRLIGANIPPSSVLWTAGAQDNLFNEAPRLPEPASFSVPASFMPLAEDVICHSDPERFALLYELLWRIVQGERALLSVASDPLVHRLLRMQKAVRRDLHKMTAFVRFRRVTAEDGEEHYVAWFEPEHHILKRAAEFFVNRFAAMRWSILTPQGALHWDGREVAHGLGVSREHAPESDGLEQWWRTYYRATFNPARANPAAMRAEMPKKYWRNLPEASLIPELLDEAEARTSRMLQAERPAPRRAPAFVPHAPSPALPGTLAQIRQAASACQRCPLFRDATQTVFGEGPQDARIIFVGEQPGDQEDLAGRPFVGPAGQMFDRALDEAGIDRSRVYVTNAVKHFKYEPRGKRRIHKKPNNHEIEVCRWWLDQEIGLIKPDLLVALGASAARALTGRDVTISRERGRLTTFLNGSPGLITVHPSFLLRLPDAAAQQREYGRFVQDLRLVRQNVPTIAAAA
jgi:DNA polymerase